VNGFGELPRFSRLGPDGNDSGEHGVPPFESGVVSSVGEPGHAPGSLVMLAFIVPECAAIAWGAGRTDDECYGVSPTTVR